MELKEQLTGISESIGHLQPELVLILSIVISLVLGLVLKKNKQIILNAVSLVTYLISFLLIIQTWPHQPVSLFGGMMRLDDFSAFFKLLFFTGGFLTILISKQKEETASEYIILIDAILLGACLLAMSMNFVMLLLSLELISLPSYMLAGFAFDRKSAEGSLKYFLFGTVATACMIYGISLIYGLSSTLDFSSNEFIEALIDSKAPLLFVASFLILAGLLFKIAAVPFHLWAPDVYESAPTPVVAFLSVVPKLAGLAIFIKMVLALNLFGQSALPWSMIVAIVAILSIVIGNLSALAQTNPKRMLAYSSIAQSGFLLIGLATMSMEGIHFTMFYAVIFLIMNFLVFAVLHQFENSISIQSVNNFVGLGRLSIFPAFVFLIGMISLTGLPPTAGFTAKLLIFSSLWTGYQDSQSIVLLVLFGVGLINTVIALFYYLKIPYLLFLKEPASESIPIKISPLRNLLHLILVVLLIYLFLLPGGLMGWINQITFVL
jgi:NADH-quinone oxidoreductase subunit N